MTGYWRGEFNKIAERAINNYAALYKEKPNDVQIMMLVDDKGHAEFHTCVNRKEKERVKFIHIYHRPGTKFSIDGMTFIVPKMIALSLLRLFAQYNIDPVIGNVLVQLQEGEVYMFLMAGTTMTKLLTDDEVLSDEQVMADQMKMEDS